MLNGACSGSELQRPQDRTNSGNQDVSSKSNKAQHILVSLPKIQVVGPLKNSTPEQSAVLSPQKLNTVPSLNAAPSYMGQGRTSSLENQQDQTSEQEDTPPNSVSSTPMVPQLTRDKVSTGTLLVQESQVADSQKSSSSIGSASPLIQRLKQKAAVNRSTKSYQATVEEMVSILHDCHTDLKDEVALTARAFLEEARDTCRNAPKDFVDKVSPWKPMKTLPHSTGYDSAGTTTAKIESIVS